eukprot:9090559-Pyramimonas_sp.AAC.1
MVPDWHAALSFSRGATARKSYPQAQQTCTRVLRKHVSHHLYRPMPVRIWTCICVQHDGLTTGFWVGGKGPGTIYSIIFFIQNSTTVTAY